MSRHDHPHSTGTAPVIGDGTITGFGSIFVMVCTFRRRAPRSTRTGGRPQSALKVGEMPAFKGWKNDTDRHR